MPIGQDFADFLWDRVTVSPFSSFSAVGMPVYSSSAASTYTGLVQYGRHKVTKADGEEVPANVYVYLGPTSSGGLPPALTPKDKLTLSAQWGSSSDPNASPRLISVDRYADESSGRYVVVAHCA